jgi:hypothetical protein
MRFANAIKLDRRSGGRRGICCAPTPLTKALRVSSQILPKQFFSSPTPYSEPSSTSAIASNLLTVFQFRPVDEHCNIFSMRAMGIFGRAIPLG